MAEIQYKVVIDMSAQEANILRLALEQVIDDILGIQFGQYMVASKMVEEVKK
ncbi:hypothetical protein LCGC14_0740450 [marine sediment metagenome]|uniref:Uncharacterized protein n=1 Tax=marine sediment metagenome TaxID=412755 RepID=A0A0F9SRR5_9ZZZZ